MNSLPQAVKVCLWSYDVENFDLTSPDNRVRVIRNVLNRGTLEAVDWLRDNFSSNEIAEAIRTSNTSEWSKKSLALWSNVFNISPSKAGRFS